MKTHPVFSAKYPTALCVMGLVINLLGLTESPHIQDFCVATVSALWTVITAGDSKHLKPEGYEMVWSQFHRFRLTSVEKWLKLMTSLELNERGQHVVLTYQFLLQAVVDLIMKGRNRIDLPDTTTFKGQINKQ